jgi:uncharacterized protein (DUF433 family)
MDYAAFFVRDPQICGGQLTVKGTRVTVRTILPASRRAPAKTKYSQTSRR